MARLELTQKQENFCQVYIALGNASEAYRKAYPSSLKWKKKTVNEAASRMTTNSKVLARIKELQKETARKLLISDDSVLKEHARIGFSDIRRIFDENGRLKSVEALDADTAAAIASMKVVTKNIGDGEVEYTHEIKLWPKNQALESLSKHLGLFAKDNAQKRPDLMTSSDIEMELAELGRELGQ